VYKKERSLNKKKTASHEIQTFTAEDSSEIILAGEYPA
jgi:hypothetical protein